MERRKRVNRRWLPAALLPAAGIVALMFVSMLVALQSERLATTALLPYRGWSYADLRGLGDGQADDKAFAAAYTRNLALDVAIRFDFLQMDELRTQDLTIALQTRPASFAGPAIIPAIPGVRFPASLVLSIPAHGPLAAYTLSGQPVEGLALLVLRDPVERSLEVRFRRAAAGIGLLGFRFEAWLTQAGHAGPLEAFGPFNSTDAPPPPAPLLLAFWDSYPAYTPAQALRRWDGAHSGPYGGRHGLYNLLRTARAAHIPLALLDLKQSASLPALDYSGGLGLVQELNANHLLILPENGSLVSPLFPPSRFSFSPLASAPATSRGQPRIAAGRWLSGSPGDLQTDSDQLGDDPQVDDGGLTSAVLRLLLRTAAPSAQRKGAVAVLGGDLPSSAWGDPALARVAFKDLNTHPWIKVLFADDLQARRISLARLPDPLPFYRPEADAHLSSRQAALQVEIQDAPPGPLKEAARQALQAFLSPVFPAPPGLAELRAGEIGQVSYLLAADRWAADPQPGCDCSRDLDGDRQPECWLASKTVLAIVEPSKGGVLAYMFALEPDGPHQAVAPGAQFASGLSDPATWQASAGSLEETQVLRGAFDEPGRVYQAQAQPGSVILSSAGGWPRKTYRLLPDGIQLEYDSGPGENPPGESLAVNPSPSELVISLALDPWTRFSPGWAKRYYAIPAQLGPAQTTAGWGLLVGPLLLFRTSQPGDGLTRGLEKPSVQMTGPTSFLDAQALFAGPEDPNREPPPGYYLPLPMAEIRLNHLPRIILVEITFRYNQVKTENFTSNHQEMSVNGFR